MSTPKEQFSHFAAILAVKQISKSQEFYTKLGFQVQFEWNEPVDYVVLTRGGVSIHLSKRMDDNQPSQQHAALYIFVEDVDQVYHEFVEKDISIQTPLSNREYKMRDFDIKDPDGYILTFGQGT